MKTAFIKAMKAAEQRERNLLTSVLFFEKSSFGNYRLRNQTGVLSLSDALGICAHVQEPEAILIEANDTDELETRKSDLIQKMENLSWITQTFN